jgi:predicted transcriptional regulator
MIDALFGSKTRVKLLYLFLNNPGKSFYVREITRLIDEQINSVRRELANMLQVGIITSETGENKLYYSVNQRYEYYVAFRAIFADGKLENTEVKREKTHNWYHKIEELANLRLALVAGVLVKGSTSPIDLLIVGDVSTAKVKAVTAQIEKIEAREIAYSILSYEEFYYRLSVRDRFITQIINGKHVVLLDADNVLKRQ